MIRPQENTLRHAGFAGGANGSAILSGRAAGLFEAWMRLLTSHFAGRCDERVDAPSSIAAPLLERTGYVANFPQQVIRCEKNDRNVPHFRTPAACFHVYPMMGGTPLERDLVTVQVGGSCARYEGGEWQPPFRLSSFHMLEFVHVGNAELVTAGRDAVLEEIESLFARVAMRGAFEVATDAFFLSSGSGAEIIQKMKGLKREFRVQVAGESVALASVNLHEDYFGQRFNIRTPQGDTAWSFCAAFGIERLTAAGLLEWGASADAWPEVLRV